MVSTGAHHDDSAGSDLLAERKAFQESRAGVKGLADAGIKELPRMFHAPPHLLHDRPIVSPHDDHPDFTVPVIDLELGAQLDHEKRKHIVAKVRDAAQNWGFFQIVNHGISSGTLEEMKAGALRFFNQDVKAKKDFFEADPISKLDYGSNSNISTAPALNWCDSVLFEMAPNPARPEQIPDCVREILTQFSGEMFKLGDLLLSLLSEALGLPPNHLKESEHCAEVMGLGAHYYPPCPQPELTLGSAQHKDVNFVSILFQDHVGGLQVVRRDQWVDVPPRSDLDALVINIGDMLQVISNDKFKSVEHRVVVKSKTEPRVSIGAFFGYGPPPVTRMCGPIKELLSENNPPKYRETTVQEFFMARGKSLLPNLKPENRAL